MEDKSDILVKKFLRGNISEIDDSSFTKNVLENLPEKKSPASGWIVPVFTIIGVILALILVDFQQVALQILRFIQQTPVVYLWFGFMGVLFSLVGYYLFKEEQVRLFL